MPIAVDQGLESGCCYLDEPSMSTATKLASTTPMILVHPTVLQNHREAVEVDTAGLVLAILVSVQLQLIGWGRLEVGFGPALDCPFTASTCQQCY
jgi:hypothetical protein